MFSQLLDTLFSKIYVFSEDRKVEEIKNIAEGGFGYVSLVRDCKSKQEYAMKKIISQDKKTFELAQHEIKILNNLPQHKNVIQFFGSIVCLRDQAQHQGHQGSVHGGVTSSSCSATKEICMLLEYCNGGTLLDWVCHQGKNISEISIFKPLQDIAEAVFMLHSHRPPIIRIIYHDNLF